MRKIIILFLLIFGAISCNTNKVNTLFELLSNSKTNINFQNNLNYTEELNPYTYRNFYNGGGVGVGDFNNDSLQDIFFTGNLVSNKLYLNKDLIGGFTFNRYWSSTQHVYHLAWVQYFTDGFQILSSSETSNSAVRSVRAF